jgi:hypothetical protein
MSCPARVERFGKSRGCPAANELLSLQSAKPLLRSSAELISHLVTCDFCGVEAQFLSSHNSTTVSYESAEMAGYLRKLAVAFASATGLSSKGCLIIAGAEARKSNWQQAGKGPKNSKGPMRPFALLAPSSLS